jgi:hypothetical protein
MVKAKATDADKPQGLSPVASPRRALSGVSKERSTGTPSQFSTEALRRTLAHTPAMAHTPASTHTPVEQTLARTPASTHTTVEQTLAHTLATAHNPALTRTPVKQNILAKTDSYTPAKIDCTHATKITTPKRKFDETEVEAFANLAITTNKMPPVISGIKKRTKMSDNEPMDETEHAKLAKAAANVTIDEATDSLEDLLAKFENTHKKQKKAKAQATDQSKQDTTTKPSTSYASATAASTRQKMQLTIFQTTKSQQPLTYANYLEVKRILTVKRSAEVITLLNKGIMPDDPNNEINFDPLPLDSDSRGFPLVVNNKDSLEWIMKQVATINIEGVVFRAWKPDEKPQVYELQLYLNESHNALEEPHIHTLLKHYNPGLPVDDYQIDDIIEQSDRLGHDKGRIVMITAGGVFHDFCQARGFKLHFIGGSAPCQTPEEKARLANIKKRDRDLAGLSGSGNRTTTATSAYNQKPGAGQTQKMLPGGKIPKKPKAT